LCSRLRLYRTCLITKSCSIAVTGELTSANHAADGTACPRFVAQPQHERCLSHITDASLGTGFTRDPFLKNILHMRTYAHTYIHVCIHIHTYVLLEDITTEPHAHEISADIVRVWLSGYILQHEAKGRRFGTLETAKSGRWVR
jgi:hypothetical protein